ncbi:DUF928 domain-containing protein [Thermocoleostomius sinensis]|uniref:DUF928 domain-containing protein n=1 Tax=Thermocoleostomius sinensis A174 TaxID=2016057 RepID=A0A9E8ZDF7_9CYAN|nr:DUF928 domain-containing protein [Thermocoleostomius sinensis]WAL59220.1 DUF928 domain-containing protein [Thermocoleostomius sinensis A174]
MKRYNFLIQSTASTLLLLLFSSSGWLAIQPAESRFLGNQLVSPVADRVSAEFNLVQASIRDPIRFIPPTAQAAPTRGRSRGGASRGNCSMAEQPLMALVPNAADDRETMATVATPITLTTASHPTFWFYVPTALTSDRPAEFWLLDADGSYVYTSLLHGTDTAGIVKVTLPNTVSPLEPEKPYRWIFQLICETGATVDVWGEIQRVDLSPTLKAQLAQSSHRDQSALYAAQGIWLDALTTLAELRLSEPTNTALVTDWRSLLQSAHLAEVINHPLLPCCQAFTEAP